jgi:lipopolysaccharide export LptBFGC system permease protein LptF
MSEDKAEEEKTEEEKEMELHAKYDAEAMTYLSYVLYPLVVCYAGYSLYYESHKSWYSFVLAVLTGCVYTFGFISQTAHAEQRTGVGGCPACSVAVAYSSSLMCVLFLCALQ